MRTLIDSVTTFRLKCKEVCQLQWQIKTTSSMDKKLVSRKRNKRKQIKTTSMTKYSRPWISCLKLGSQMLASTKDMPQLVTTIQGPLHQLLLNLTSPWHFKVSKLSIQTKIIIIMSVSCRRWHRIKTQDSKQSPNLKHLQWPINNNQHIQHLRHPQVKTKTYLHPWIQTRSKVLKVLNRIRTNRKKT